MADKKLVSMAVANWVINSGKPIAPDTLNDRFDATEECLSNLVDKLFAEDQRDAGMLVSQASSTVGCLGQQVKATLEANNRQLQLCREAARALIADVRRRYPGEELRCPLMIALEASIEGVGE